MLQLPTWENSRKTAQVGAGVVTASGKGDKGTTATAFLQVTELPLTQWLPHARACLSSQLNLTSCTGVRR